MKRIFLSIAILIGLAALCTSGQNQNFGASLSSSQTFTGTNTFTQQIISSLATGTAPFSIASTTPVTNLVVTNHPKVQACGTAAACSATATTASQIVFGSAPLASGTPSTVTITGISPAFTSTSTYFCVVTDDTTTASALVTFTKNSGSSFTITGPATNTDVIAYICVGN